MTMLDILVYPDPRLRKVAEPVARVDDEIRKLVADMAQTMYGAPGIGLAAVQVNVPRRVIVIDISENRDDLRVFINPEIVSSEGTQEMDEGCLSVPDVYAPVTRAGRVRVRAIDANGERFEFDAEGLLATCIQHEIDHLDGKVFVDYLSRLKQDRIRKRLLKQTRRGSEKQPAEALVL